MPFVGLKLKEIINLTIIDFYNMIQKIKEQHHEIQQIALRNIQGNTFCLLPENLLYSLVKSEEVEVKEEALKRILAIR